MLKFNGRKGNRSMTPSEILAVIALASVLLIPAFAIYKYVKQEKECPLKK